MLLEQPTPSLDESPALNPWFSPALPYIFPRWHLLLFTEPCFRLYYKRTITEASFTFKFLQRSTCGLPRSFCSTGDEQRITLIALKNCSSNRKKKEKAVRKYWQVMHAGWQPLHNALQKNPFLKVCESTHAPLPAFIQQHSASLIIADA